MILTFRSQIARSLQSWVQMDQEKQLCSSSCRTGKDYQGYVHRRPGVRIGWLPQKLHVDPLLPLTVRRFLSLGAPVSGAVIRQNMEETGIEHLWNHSVQNLSGGEFQRVMLTRALLVQPDLLILDEPAQGVDYRGQADIYDLITRIRDTRHCAIIMISHDLHIVMGATDRVVCLHHHICCSGQLPPHHTRPGLGCHVWFRFS